MKSLQSWKGKRVILFSSDPAKVHVVGTLSDIHSSRNGIAVALTDVTPQRETRSLPDMVCYLHKPEFGNLELITDPNDDPSQPQS